TEPSPARHAGCETMQPARRLPSPAFSGGRFAYAGEGHFPAVGIDASRLSAAIPIPRSTRIVIFGLGLIDQAAARVGAKARLRNLSPPVLSARWSRSKRAMNRPPLSRAARIIYKLMR